VSREQVVAGRVVGELVRRHLSEPAPDGEAGSAGAVVVSSFNAPEVRELVSTLERFVAPGQSSPVTVVVAAPEGDDFVPEWARLGPDRSLTWHRNNNITGLVLVELAEASDRQGLGQMFRLTDQSILAPGGHRDAVLDLITDVAWRGATPPPVVDPPQALKEGLRQVFAGASGESPVPLRPWIAYVVRASDELSQLKRAVTAPEAAAALGQRLGELSLFPDLALFEDHSRVERRLARNVFLADLRNPQGKPVPEDFLTRRIDAVELRDSQGTPLTQADQARLREVMRHFAEHADEESRKSIEFAYWSQLFESGTSRSGLGARVRDALAETPARLAEFEELELATGLDENDQEAAQALVDAEPRDGAEPLIELLPRALRRRIEKLAIPASSTEDDPLRGLLQHLVGLDDLAATDTRLSLDLSAGPSGAWTRALFTFLYGATLQELSGESTGGLSSKLIVDPVLTSVSWPAAAADVDGDDDVETGADEEDPWAPVHLALFIGDESSPAHRLRWRPEAIAGFAAMVRVAAGAVDPTTAAAQDLEGWTREQQAALVLHGVELADTELNSWSRPRADHLARWVREGVSIDALREYVDEWGDVLHTARAELVPQDAPLAELERLLDHDLLPLGTDRVALLATHPLRARWFASHLEQLRDDIAAALEGRFRLNPENDALYFSTVRSVSPHRQPPFLATRDRRIGLAVREHALHEEYATVTGAASSSPADGVTDDASIDAIASTVGAYLNAFPHKTDGLSLLILSREGDVRLPYRLVREIVRAAGRSLVVELHVVAPLSSHRHIAKAFEGAADETEREQRLLPKTQVVMHPWDENDTVAQLTALIARIDIAVVPNLFGAHTRIQEQTRPAEIGAAGRFRPWLDDTVHTSVRGTSENVSRVLLPRAPDPLLEHWSTLNVRRSRAAPVAPEAPENTDYLTIQVTFDRNRELFRKLHDVAHWVVTLDAFIGRDQIDAMEAPPDVIRVKTGVGKNKTYTMVVSSQAGRQFVIKGLDRKLRHNLGLVDPAARSVTAERLYEVGRNTVPGVMLRALGLGRSTEEIVGLVLTRFAVEEIFAPPAHDRGLEWWFSLDDRTHWFGGAHQPRADLLRVFFTLVDDRLRLEVRVIESKYRRTEDLGAADRQIAHTVDLLRMGLAPSSGPDDPNDLMLWRRELLEALDETSKRRAAKADLPAIRYLADADVETVETIRSLILEGEYDLIVEGVVCSIATRAESPGGPDLTPEAHTLIRINKPDIRRLLERLERREPPDSPGTAVVPPPDDRPPGPGPVEVALPSDLTGGLEPGPGHVVVPDAGRSASAPGDAPGLHSRVLEQRYQAVLDAFHEFRVDVRPSSGDRFDDGPAFYLLRVVPGNGVPADKLMGRAADLKLRLALPAEMHLRTYLDRGAVVFEIPKQADERYDVDARRLWADAEWPEGHLYVPVGADISGAVVGLDFSSSETPHLLIAGTTGSGKSVALESILLGLIERHSPDALQLHLVDPKGTELADLEQAPHVRPPIGIDADDAIEVLSAGVEEMQRRYGLMKEKRVRSLPDYNAARAENDEALPWWLIVLDEYADLTADPDEKKQIEALLKRLAQKARAAGIHLIIATQRPSADVISPVVRSNMPAQLALRVRTATDSRVILDESGAEALAGRGDAFLRTHRGLQRIQCARVTPRRA
jgi:DNA segregation ATPase FtsK/SpoIIIE, S-DNA-T family